MSDRTWGALCQIVREIVEGSGPRHDRNHRRPNIRIFQSIGEYQTGDDNKVDPVTLQSAVHVCALIAVLRQLSRISSLHH